MTAKRRPFLRHGAFLLVIAGAFLVTSCGSGGGVRKRDAEGNLVPTERELDPASTLYSDMIDAADRGDCSAENLSVLTCFAHRGHGYEGAQTTLGQCMIRTGDAGNGVVWLRRAADAGWPDAQKALASLYLEGKGVTRNNVEAGFWTYLYAKNPSLLSLGVQPDMSVAQKMRKTLSDEERAEARRRADTWAPTYWESSTQLDAKTAASCRVRMKKMPQKHIPIPTANPEGY
jgi:hypothetical protein